MNTIDAIAYLSGYYFARYSEYIMFYYVISHMIWAIYFRYQGESRWYLALLPFYLQFLKLKICYEDMQLPIIYSILCIVCSLFMPLWIIPWIFQSIISTKFHKNMTDHPKPAMLGWVPFYGKVYMMKEAIEDVRDAAVRYV